MIPIQSASNLRCQYPPDFCDKYWLKCFNGIWNMTGMNFYRCWNCGCLTWKKTCLCEYCCYSDEPATNESKFEEMSTFNR